MTYSYADTSFDAALDVIAPQQVDDQAAQDIAIATAYVMGRVHA